MKWGGRSNPVLTRWFGCAVILEIVGLTLHFIAGSLVADIVWLLLTIVACALVIVGYQRHLRQQG